MFRAAQTILDSRVLAEEIVQDAYLRLLENESRSVENPSAWLIKVTRNLAIDQARRRVRERELLQLVPGIDMSEHHDGQHAIESRLFEIVACLLHVSDSQVTAIVLLHAVFGMSYQDIATICSRSPTACRQTVSRALRKCFSALDSEETFDKAPETDMYVHAILEASTAPLIDCLNVDTPVSIQNSLAPNHRRRFSDSLPSNAVRTRQMLVLTPTGVKWALVLDGMVLCPLESIVYSSSVALT